MMLRKLPFQFLSSPEFIRVRRWKKLWLVSTFLSMLVVLASQWWLTRPAALATSWTQTDWSGGVAAGTVTGTVSSYSSSGSVSTSTAGQVTLGAAANWWDTNWSYRKAITINNTASSQTNYQVKVQFRTDDLVTASKLNSACNDMRFVTASGTVLPYFIDYDSPCNTANTVFWVKVNSISSGDTTIYAYYGNSGAAAVADGNATFEFFDDFTTASLDTSKWTVNAYGSISGNISGGSYYVTSASNGWLTTLGNTSSQHQIKYGTVSDVAVEWRLRVSQTVNNRMGQVFIGLIDNTGAIRAWNGFSDEHSQIMYCFPNTMTSAGAAFGASVCPLNIRQKITLNGTTARTYFNDNLSNTGTANNITKIALIATTYPGYAMVEDAHFEWIFTRKEAATPPTISTYGDEESQLASSGYLISNIFDAELPSNWGSLSYTSTGGTTAVKVRTGSMANMSDAVDFASCTAVSSGADISSNNCVDDGDQYIQYQVSLATNLGIGPTFQDITILYQPSDADAPTTNATSISISDFTSGEWLNTPPTISWTAGVDAPDGTGILGYCLALDEVPFATESSNGLDPVTDAGVLDGLDDGQAFSPTNCRYIVTGSSVNLAAVSGLSLESGKRYFFSIKAIDQAGNIFTGTTSTYQDLLNFKYDNTPPTTPSYLSVPGSFVSSKDITVTWPTASGQAAADTDSGLAGLQYRIGSGGTWYGIDRTGAQDLTDLLPNSGTYTMDPTVDYPLLNEGSNVFYLRAMDYAGNPSAQFATGALKINTIAPAEVTNLTVSPSDNTSNAYSFEWDPPAGYSGEVATLRYCYTINTLPTVNTCSFTDAGVTSLSESAYATQPGTNTMYVVPKDETGNINYSAYESITFTYSGSAPGIPLSVEVNDISTKASSSWKLAVSWAAPSSVGAGVSTYKVYRSASASSCTSDFGSFSEIGQVGGSSTVYSDSNLTQQTYHYCIKACDSANNCGAVSSSASGYPDGRYTEPAALTSGPSVGNITSRQALVTWSTDRASDSRIQYGTKSGEYFTEEVGNSEQKTSHEVKLENLFAGTTYYYRAKWIDEDGNEGRSEEKSFTTNPPPSISDPKPKSVSLNTAVLQFTAKGATKVKVYYGTNTSFGNIQEIQTSTNESTYTVQLENLSDGTKYFYKINPINEDAIEYETSILSFETIARPRISQVQIQQVPNTSQSTLLVSWQTNTETSSIITYYPTDSPDSSLDEVKTIFRLGEHKMVLTGLRPQTQYTLIIKGRDKLGNEALSSPQIVTTATDTRPPSIRDIQIETSSQPAMSTNQTDNLSQLIVTWTTDELSTSQVEYGEGINGSYAQKSTKDANLTYNHTVVINGLASSKVFHLRAVSSDAANNNGYSGDLVAITNKPSDVALDLVIQNLGEAFSFLRQGSL